MARTYIKSLFEPINSEYSRNLARQRQRTIRGGLNKLFVDGYPPVPKIRDKIELWVGCSIFELAEHLRRGPYVTMLDFRVKESWHLDHRFPVSLIPDSDIHLAHYYKNLEALPPSINMYKSNMRPMNEHIKGKRHETWQDFIEWVDWKPNV
jgi:hypothetical protein